MTLEQSHKDRRRDVIGQVCRHLERAFPHDFRDVHLEDISRHNGDVIIGLEGLGQHGWKFLVQLNSRYLSASLGKPLGQRADSRSDFQHAFSRLDFRRIDNALHDARINQEVLAEFLAHAQAKSLQNMIGYRTAGNLRL